MSQKAKEPLPRRAYRISEWAEAHGVCRSFVYKLMKDGRLSYRQVGAVRLIPADEEGTKPPA